MIQPGFRMVRFSEAIGIPSFERQPDFGETLLVVNAHVYGVPGTGLDRFLPNCPYMYWCIWLAASTISILIIPRWAHWFTQLFSFDLAVRTSQGLYARAFVFVDPSSRDRMAFASRRDRWQGWLSLWLVAILCGIWTEDPDSLLGWFLTQRLDHSRPIAATGSESSGRPIFRWLGSHLVPGQNDLLPPNGYFWTRII